MGLGAALWQELVAGFPDGVEMTRIVVRLLVAIVLGGILGFQRAARAAKPRECEPTCS